MTEKSKFATMKKQPSKFDMLAATPQTRTMRVSIQFSWTFQNKKSTNNVGSTKRANNPHTFGGHMDSFKSLFESNERLVH